MAKENVSGTAFGRELAPGVRVGGGRYILKRLLGRGEISEVWLVHDAKLGRDAALKFLPRSLLSDDAVIKDLEKETGRNLLLAHRHIAATYEFVRDYHSAGIVMEYVDGWSLAALKVDRPQRRYRVEEIEWWIRQLGAALEFAHSECGILHRDLKTSNLLVNAHDELKLTDFGIAQSIRGEHSRRGQVRGVYGGIGFLSPQQVMGEEPTRLDDVYSLGATIYDLLTGTPPFYKGEIVAQVCSLNPPAMNERLRELGLKGDPVPPVWEATIAACLAKNPAERPQTVVEVQQMLDRFELPQPIPSSDQPGVAEAVAAETAPVPPAAAASPVAAEPSTKAEVSTQTDSAAAAGPPAMSEPVKVGESGRPAEVAPTPEPLAGVEPARAQGVSLSTVALLVAVVIALTLGLSVLLRPDRGSTGSLRDAGPPGSPDRSFDAGNGANNDVRSLAIQRDGKILVGGRFSLFNGVPHRGIVRLNPDGSLDTNFVCQATGTVHAIMPESKGAFSNGSILAGGDFAGFGGQPAPVIARLNADGKLNQGLDGRGPPNAEVRVIVVQPDGNILAAGSFTRMAGRRQNRIARLTPDFALDGTFRPGGGASAIIWTLALQADGKILVGGSFTTFNRATVGRIVRLNPDGTTDPSFHVGTGADAPVIALSVQSDGKIVLAGDFLSVNGLPRHHVARLNPDGSVDATFDPGIGPDGGVRSVAVQPNGKIIIGGAFNNLDGAPCHRLARLNADGSPDQSFKTGQGASGSIWRVVLQPDGSVLAGGTFTSFDGVACGRIVRLFGDPVSAPE
jgi:uncharacterized delta-60 repeat protein